MVNNSNDVLTVPMHMYVNLFKGKLFYVTFQTGR